MEVVNNFFISIIIPVFNEEEHIEQCLSSLMNLQTKKDNYEIILVDNGSTDDTLNIANKFPVTILSKLDCTISSLRNYGASYAQGNILAFVDGDCAVSRDWLNNALPHFNRTNNAAVGSRLLHFESTWVARAWSNFHKKKKITGQIDWLPSGNMLLLRKCFDRVKGFDENLETTEDYDLCQRLRQEGYKLYSDPKVSSLHLDPPKTLAEFFKKELWHGKEMVRMFSRKHIKLLNYPALLYAMFYLVVIIGLLIGTIVYLISQSNKLLIVFAIGSIIVPSALAVKTLSHRNSLPDLFALALLYMIYGFARALCLLDPRNYLKK